MGQRTKRRVRYNVNNQPPSHQAAKDKLEEALVNEEQVAAQLEFGSATDFDTDDDYRDWKLRASNALGHIRAERKFLQDWLKSNSQHRVHALRQA